MDLPPSAASMLKSRYMCKTAFCHCDKILKINQRRGDYFGTQLQKYHPMVTCPCCFGPVVRQNVMATAHAW
jgi:hypothetical protein